MISRTSCEEEKGTIGEEFVLLVERLLIRLVTRQKCREKNEKFTSESTWKKNHAPTISGMSSKFLIFVPIPYSSRIFIYCAHVIDRASVCDNKDPVYCYFPLTLPIVRERWVVLAGTEANSRGESIRISRPEVSHLLDLFLDTFDVDFFPVPRFPIWASNRRFLLLGQFEVNLGRFCRGGSSNFRCFWHPRADFEKTLLPRPLFTAKKKRSKTKLVIECDFAQSGVFQN